MAVPGVRVKDSDIVYALKKTGGVITHACKLLNCSHQCIYDRIQQSEEIAKTLEEERKRFDSELLDAAENQLLKKVREGDNTMVIFSLKTKGRKRGYAQDEIKLTNVNIDNEFFKFKENALSDESKQKIKEKLNKKEQEKNKEE